MTEDRNHLYMSQSQPMLYLIGNKVGSGTVFEKCLWILSTYKRDVLQFPVIPIHDAEKLVHLLLLSYCISLLWGCLNNSLRRLQLIQNTASSEGIGTKDHINPVLASIPWQPINHLYNCCISMYDECVSVPVLFLSSPLFVILYSDCHHREGPSLLFCLCLRPKINHCKTENAGHIQSDLYCDCDRALDTLWTCLA